VRLRLSGEVWYWRGPAPHHFVTVPEDLCRDLQDVAGRVSYGWGMIPVTVTLGSSTWTTSLWPKDGGYIVPLKAEVRRREHADEGATVALELTVDT
jgi:hypothetical protein